MNTFGIFCILFSIAATANAAGMSCKGLKGEDVDWFIFYKIPSIKGAAWPVGWGRAMQYMDPSNLSWQTLKLAITELNQPVAYTLDQVYQKKSEVFGFYNDELPPSNIVPNSTFTYGHAKGAFAFDKTSGFWMIHSVPRFPNWLNGSYFYPTNGYPNGQIGLCLSLKTDSLQQLETILRLNQPWVYDSFISSEFSRTYSGLNSILASNNSPLPNGVASKAVVPLTTLGGLKVQSFAKHDSTKIELYTDWMAPTLKSSFDVSTWQIDAFSSSKNIPSSCNGTYQVRNVRQVQLPNGIDFSNLIDHSKWAISTDSKLAWICIGDINRQTGQKNRHGGTSCFQHEQVWNAFRSAISAPNDIDSCAT